MLKVQNDPQKYICPVKQSSKLPHRKTGQKNRLTVTYNLKEENGQTKLTATQGDYSTVGDGEKDSGKH